MTQDSGRAGLDEIFEECHTEIKRRIHLALRRESNPTLQTTDIVHELYLRLAQSADLSFDDRRAVLNLIALKTREYLVDVARRRKAQIRGGKYSFVSLTFASHVGYGQPVDALLLDDALEKLAAVSPIAAEIAHLRLILGLTEREIMSVTGRSRSTVGRWWEFGKVWLIDAMRLSSPRESEETQHA